MTIVAKGMSGGHTAFIPEKDKSHISKSELITQMDVAMGGRAAEEILLGKENITGTIDAQLQKMRGLIYSITNLFCRRRK